MTRNGDSFDSMENPITNPMQLKKQSIAIKTPQPVQRFFFSEKMRKDAAVIPTDWINKLKSLPWRGVKLRISTVTGNATTPPPRGVDPAIMDPNIMASING